MHSVQISISLWEPIPYLLILRTKGREVTFSSRGCWLRGNSLLIEFGRTCLKLSCYITKPVTLIINRNKRWSESDKNNYLLFRLTMEVFLEDFTENCVHKIKKIFVFCWFLTAPEYFISILFTINYYLPLIINVNFEQYIWMSLLVLWIPDAGKYRSIVRFNIPELSEADSNPLWVLWD